ncbi:hypothetical protein V8G54_030163 [Vigna mungo]|uniref:AMMECR1 domain-containing protein n=1 Tax=Vigna mungo TaxID=3915 RepID=A0AAQ3MV42_VIGMU
MVSANQEMVVYCFDTLVSHYNNQEPPPPAFDQAQHPLFVTWKKVVNGGDPRLRGCIGTLEARSLISGLKDYALTSALRDRRFPPIQANELPFLECTVSILTDYETANNYLDWEMEQLSGDPEVTDSKFGISQPLIEARKGCLPKTQALGLILPFEQKEIYRT